MFNLCRALFTSLFVAALCGAFPAHAQTAIYGTFTASRLAGSPAGDFLYGGTAGLVAHAANFGPHLALSGEVQGRFVTHSGEGLYGLTLGPRFSVPVHAFGFTPYGSFLVGFARYHDPSVNGTTDNTFQASAGATRRLKKRIDLQAEYSWSHLAAFQNRYNPQSYSAGILFYLSR